MLRQRLCKSSRGGVCVWAAALHNRVPTFEKRGSPRLVVAVLTDTLVERESGGRLGARGFRGSAARLTGGRCTLVQGLFQGTFELNIGRIAARDPGCAGSGE